MALIYRDALSLIRRGNWNDSTIKEKLDALQAIEDEMAHRQGRNRCLVKEQSLNTDDYLECGRYDFFQRKEIVINTAVLNQEDSETAVQTVLHEGYHAYQDQAANGLAVHDNEDQVALWRDNLDIRRYISYERNERTYSSQALESDANKYTDEAYRQLRWESDAEHSGQSELLNQYHPAFQKLVDENEKYRAVRREQGITN